MPPSFQVPESAAESISRALLEHFVPIGCVEESLVQYPVHGLAVETRTQAGSPAPGEITLQALGCYGATLLWKGFEPLSRRIAVRLPAFASLGWIESDIAWMRAAGNDTWLVGCDFDWLATTAPINAQRRHAAS